MAEQHNFTIEKGATWRQNIQWKDDDGLAIDLTNYTARMQLRREYRTNIIHELTTENGGIDITALTGEIDLLIEATDTADFIDTKVLYDLELINGTEVVRLLSGCITISENVTV